MTPPFIAPFWSDVDTRGRGEVSFFATSDAAFVEVVNMIVSSGFNSSHDSNDILEKIFVATWSSVGYFDNHTDRVSYTPNQHS